MASNGNTSEVTATMDKLSLNGNSKYLPPHRKYGSFPRPPPPTPATSSMNDTDQVTSTNGQKEDTLASEKKQDTKAAAAMDTKKSYPHRKYAATKPAPSDKGEDATPLKEADTAPVKEAGVNSAKEADVADSWEEEASDVEEQPKPEHEQVASVKSEESLKRVDDILAPKTVESSLDSATQPKPAAPVSNSTSKAPLDISKAPHHRYAKTPAAPPPTPSSPSITPQSLNSRPSPARTSTPPERRPEKTMAVANRLIAGALGVKAPRRTEEQRNYDKAVREQERKRRDAERDAKKKAEEEAAKAKAAIWDD